MDKQDHEERNEFCAQSFRPKLECEPFLFFSFIALFFMPHKEWVQIAIWVLAWGICILSEKFMHLVHPRLRALTRVSLV